MQTIGQIATRSARLLTMCKSELIPLSRVYSKICSSWAGLSDHEFVDKSVECMTQNRLLADEVDRFTALLKKGRVTRDAFIWSWVRLPDRLVPRSCQLHMMAEHHAARLDLVAHELPVARNVVDLGGASDTAKEGALLSMGYSHRPDTVLIVDQLPDQRMAVNPQTGAIAGTDFNGTKVSYCYGDMTELSDISANSVDLVWSGQSIEHITADAARRTLASCFRILRPGGFLCLDTPNNRIARLASPYALLHPEHKLEYEVTDLIKVVENSGFSVVRSLSVSPLPTSARLNRLCRAELFTTPRIGEDASVGFSFYLEAKKPK